MISWERGTCGGTCDKWGEGGGGVRVCGEGGV